MRLHKLLRTLSKKKEPANDRHDLDQGLDESQTEDEFQYAQDICCPSDIMIFHAQFRSRSSLTRARALQIKELATRICSDINKGWDAPIVVEGIEWGKKKFVLKLEGKASAFEDLAGQLEKEGFEFVDAEGTASEANNRFAPGEHYAHFMEQFELMDLDQFKNYSEEEIERKLDTMAEMTLDELREVNEITPASEALVQALKAFELPRLESLRLVSDILARQPDCVEALICQAGWEKDDEKRLDLLEDAVEAGERTVDSELMTREKMWWKNHKSRPYMRAMGLLGFELMTEHPEEGLELLEGLVEMNPEDNQGIRFFLIEYYLVRRRWHQAKQMLQRYPDEDHISFWYAKYFYLYGTTGRKSKTKRALLDAFHRNPYPMYILSGVEDYPEDFIGYRRGSPEEAMEVIQLIADCLEHDYKQLHWLMDVLMSKGVWQSEDGNSGRKARILPFNG